MCTTLDIRIDDCWHHMVFAVSAESRALWAARHAVLVAEGVAA